MDPYTVMCLIGTAADIKAFIDGQEEDDRVRHELELLQINVRSIIEAPWEEGLSRLRQAFVAGEPTRSRLLEEARGKLDDVASRGAAPTALRARASTLVACLWLGQGESGPAKIEAARAVELADTALSFEYAPAEELAGVHPFERQDAAWDRARAAMSIAKLAGVRVPEDTGPLKKIPHHGFADSGERGRPLQIGPEAPLPTEVECDFFGSVGSQELARYWHRLRDSLPAGERLCWFIQATDLRVGATDTTLFAFKPEQLLTQGAFAFQCPLPVNGDVESGRDWFDWFVAFTSPDRQGRIRVNLGSEEATTLELVSRLSRGLPMDNAKSHG